MALVSYVSTPEAAEGIKARFQKMEEKGHEVPNFLRTLAHSPELLEGFLALNGALNKTKLDRKLRELAYIKASELNGCDYCLHHHRTAGKKAGPRRAADERDRRLRDERRLRRAPARRAAVRRGGHPHSSSPTS